jgi:hypothetical protein
MKAFAQAPWFGTNHAAENASALQGILLNQQPIS